MIFLQEVLPCNCHPHLSLQLSQLTRSVLRSIISIFAITGSPVSESITFPIRYKYRFFNRFRLNYQGRRWRGDFFDYNNSISYNNSIRFSRRWRWKYNRLRREEFFPGKYQVLRILRCGSKQNKMNCLSAGDRIIE